MSFFTSRLFERILTVMVVAGVLIGLYAIFNVININNQLSNNEAHRFRQSGQELDVQATTDAQARGLVAADIERRRLVKARGEMHVAGGISLILIGMSWFGYDLMRGRHKKLAAKPASTPETA